MIQVVVLLRPEAATTLQANAQSAVAREIGDVIAGVKPGLSLHAMHPDVNDPSLSAYFDIEAPDETTAQQLIERLQQNAAVEAAYLKPAAEPP